MSASAEELEDVLEGVGADATPELDVSPETDPPETGSDEEHQDEGKDGDQTTGDDTATPAGDETDDKSEDALDEDLAAQADEHQRIPVKAATDERRKRQEAEQRIKELEQQLETGQQQNQQNQDQQPAYPWQQPLQQPDQEQEQGQSQDFWENPDAIVDSRIAETEFRFRNQLLDISETNARYRHAKDFDDVKAVFLQAAQQNPYLITQANMQSDPWEFAYQQGVQIRGQAEIGNVDDFRERIRAEERARIEQEYADKAINDVINSNDQGTQNPTGKKLPGTLTNAKQSGSKKVDQEDDDLNSLLDGR